MAALTAGQHYVPKYVDGDSIRTVLYALRNVDAADTIDVAAQFSVVKRAALVGSTLAGAAVVVTITGTNITIPTGPTDDGGWLLVVGVHA